MSARAKTAALAETKAAAVNVTPARVPSLMRKCACEGAGPSCNKCSDDEKKKTMQRKASGAAPAPVAIPPVVNNVLSGPGRPLDAGTRDFMESRFGHDFGNVRVHTGTSAADSARAVGAHAYTVGNDIVFDHGRYDPHSESGRHLLAHELTHTIQQQGIQHKANESIASTSPGDAYESEADSVASRVLAGGGPFTPHAVAHAPILSRASVTGANQPQAPANPNAARLTAIKVEEAPPEADQDTAVTRRFIVKEKFPLPGSKGARAYDLWDAKAKAGALESVIDISGSGQPKTGLKQERPDTKTLRKIWLEKVGWADADAPKKWKAAGGDAESFDPPQAGKKTCDMDHIIELQIGGSNVPENMQPLDSSENRSSGSEVKNILAEKAKQVRDIYPGLQFVALHYDEVEKPSAPARGPCYIVEESAYTPGQAPIATAEGDPYPISAGGTSTNLRVKKGQKTNVTLFGSEIRANDAGATIVPGMLLRTLVLKTAPDTIKATLDNRPGTKLPIQADQTEMSMTVGPDGKLSLPKKPPKIGFNFPYLSKGTITSLTLDDNGIAGEGTIEPSVALLRGLIIGIKFTPNSLVVTTPLPVEKLKAIPGFKIKPGASIDIQLFPKFRPSGHFEFYVGSEEKPIVDGGVEIAATADGELTAKGDLKATLPGFDTATGQVFYKKSEGWSGAITLATSKLPGAKNITVTVGLSEKGYTVAGDLVIVIPTGDEVKLEVRQKAGERPVYKGKASVTIKPLHPVNLYFEYDGKNVTATGDTKFDLFGATGTIAVTYHNGTVTGKGTLAFQKGRAAGSLSVTLTPKRKFMGEGELSYKVTDSLIATAGAILDENEKLTLKGALVFTKPIPLFTPKGGSYKFFDLSISIPVPGASIGPVGIQAKFGASLSASYQFGPGELQNVKIEATFNPLEENVDPKLRFSGRLYIGASATVSGEIYGSISLDVLVAEVAGGISIIPSATLAGSFTADVLAQYEKGDYSLDAALAVELGLKLALALSAWVKAKAGISIFSVETRKDWTLAKFSYDTGLKLGVKAPIHYSSKEPFKLPSADQIVFTKPDIDVTRMLERIFGSAKSEEKEL